MAVISSPCASKASGEPMLADGVEGFGQFVAALVQPVAAGPGVGLAIPRRTGDGGFQRRQQIIWLRPGLAQTVGEIDQQAADTAQEGGHAQVGQTMALTTPPITTRPRSNGLPKASQSLLA